MYPTGRVIGHIHQAEKGFKTLHMYITLEININPCMRLTRTSRRTMISLKPSRNVKIKCSSQGTGPVDAVKISTLWSMRTKRWPPSGTPWAWWLTVRCVGRGIFQNMANTHMTQTSYSCISRMLNGCIKQCICRKVKLYMCMHNNTHARLNGSMVVCMCYHSCIVPDHNEDCTHNP